MSRLPRACLACPACRGLPAQLDCGRGIDPAARPRPQGLPASVSHFTVHAAFSQVGIPAKSGVSGGLLAVVPNLLGLACWSPALDKLGNTARGVQFCEVKRRSLRSLGRNR